MLFSRGQKKVKGGKGEKRRAWEGRGREVDFCRREYGSKEPASIHAFHKNQLSGKMTPF